MKKLFSFLSIFLITVFLWAQNPKKDFPYYYFTPEEKTFNQIRSDYMYGAKVIDVVEDYDDLDMRIYKNGRNNIFQIQFTSGHDQKESSIKSKLKEYQDVIKTYDSKIDKNAGSNVKTHILVLNSNGDFICFATFDESTANQSN